MLDAFIIERIRQRERRQKRPERTLRIDPPQRTPANSRGRTDSDPRHTPDEQRDRGVEIIDFTI